MWRWEAEDAKAVMIIIHGACEYHGRYGWLIEMWRAEGFHVLMDDLPGQGITTRKRGHIESFDQYIETVENWITEASDYELPIFLLGHSMGGLIAIRALMEKKLPIEAMVLSSPCLGIKCHPPAYLNLISFVFNKCFPSLTFHSNINPSMATRDERRSDFDLNDSLLVEKVSVRWYRELIHSIKIAHSAPEKFPNIPLLVLQAGQDHIVAKQDVLKWFNEINVDEKIYKEWVALYHDIFQEPEKEDVFQYALSFVNQHLNELQRGGDFDDTEIYTSFNDQSL
jgi:lysophospholipase